MRISCYDLDNTLLKGNSLVHMVFLLKLGKGGLLGKLRLKLFKLYLRFWVAILKRPKKQLLLRQFKGVKKSEVEQLAQRYIATEASYLAFIKKRFEEEKSSGFVMCIASAALSEVVAEISLKLGVRFWASSILEYDSKLKCTGILKEDLTGKKDSFLAKLKEENPEIDFSQSLFTSDNFEDINCLPLIPSFRAVIKSESDIPYWSSRVPELLKEVVE